MMKALKIIMERLTEQFCQKIDSANKISDSKTKSMHEGFLTQLSLDALESVAKRHAELGFTEAPQQITECLSEAIERLETFESSERALANATAGSGIAEKAGDLKELAKGLGVIQAEIAHLRGVVAQQDQSRIDIERRIDIFEPIIAPVDTNKAIGKLTVTYEGKVLAESSLYAKTNIEQDGLWGWLYDSALLLFE